MDLYGFLLFVHVMGVILWFGAGVVFQVLTERAASSDDPARTRNLVEVGDSLGKGYFGLVTLVVLATGLWLVFERDWGFDHVFIIGGLAGLVASAVIGERLLVRRPTDWRGELRALRRSIRSSGAI